MRTLRTTCVRRAPAGIARLSSCRTGGLTFPVTPTLGLMLIEWIGGQNCLRHLNHFFVIFCSLTLLEGGKDKLVTEERKAFRPSGRKGEMRKVEGQGESLSSTCD